MLRKKTYSNKNRTCLIFAICSFFLLLLLSDDIFSQKVSFGISCSAKMMKFAGKDARNIESDYLSGFEFGIFSEYTPIKNLSIEGNIVISQGGTKIGQYKHLYKKETFTRNNYLSAPILAKYSIGKKKHFIFGGGGYFSYLLNTKFTTDSISNEQFYELNNSNYKPIDYGIILSIGIKTKKIIIENRFTYGLHKFVKNTEHRHFAFLIRIGYYIL